MNEKLNWKAGAFSALMFIIMLILVSFVLTSSFILFFEFLDIPYSFGSLWESALLTFGNAIFITLIFWFADSVRRKLTIQKPVQEITQGLRQITNGDFSVRIPTHRVISGDESYNIIVNYINQMASELDGVETLRTDFVSNVSHEMKTPLAVIQNYTELLRAADLSESERQEYLDIISDSADRLAGLVTNILKLNKLENQQIFPEAAQYDLGIQLGECLLGFEPQIEEKQIQIDAELQENVMIHADAELLSLVWNNLLSNAVKFTDDGGTIAVHMKQENSAVTVTVSDTGCGMDAETQRHMFDKFYQGDTSHAAKGNGLGLALTKRIVDLSGASISVQSQPNQGSTFTVTLKAE